MPSFKDRLGRAAEFQNAFIEAFNEKCNTHEIVPFGIEQTPLHGVHTHLRFADDSTSKLVRYLPDSALVSILRRHGQEQSTSNLLEFKLQDQFIQKDSFFQRIQTDYGDQDPPLIEKTDVFQMEAAALDAYRKLETIGARVIVVGCQGPLLPDPRVVRAQYASSIIVCNTHKPSPQGRGSGTPIANTHFGSFEPVAEFCARELQIDHSVLDQVIAAVDESVSVTRE